MTTSGTHPGAYALHAPSGDLNRTVFTCSLAVPPEDSAAEPT